jgi:hypothetical protein
LQYEALVATLSTKTANALPYPQLPALASFLALAVMRVPQEVDRAHGRR